MRISGLASGMDIDEMVRQLMQVKRLPVDRLNQQKQEMAWKQEDYRGINSKLLSFRNLTFDMRLSSTYLSKAANISKPEVLDALVSSEAQEGTYKIVVDKMATSAYANSTERLVDKNNEQISANAALKDIFDTEQLKSFKVKAGDEREFIEVRFDDTTGDNIINVDIEEDSLNDLIKKINASGAGIKMFYDVNQEKVFLSSEKVGEDIIIDSEYPNDSFIESALKIDVNDTDAYRAANKATFSINGYEFEDHASNTISFGGITYTIKAESDIPIYIEVNNNVEKTVDKIKEFVNQYNELITTVNGILKEPYYRSFSALTDEQKNSMSDKEIELLEEKARSGLLRSDSILSNAMSSMRIAMGGFLEEGDISTLSQIGITTSKNYLDGGLLSIDENKLRNALQEDPNAVYELFTSKDKSGKNQGIADRVQGILDTTMKQVTNKAGQATDLFDQSYLSRQIRETDNKIMSMEVRLEQIENRYWREFTAMEKAMNEMYAQSDWLSMQLMGMMG